MSSVNGKAALRTSRAESMAYPKTNTMASKLQYFIRQNSRACFCTVAFCCLVLVLASDYLHDLPRGNGLRNFQKTAPIPHWGGAIHPGYFKAEDAVQDGGEKLLFAAVSDLDQLSRVMEGDKLVNKWKSVFVPGYLQKNADGRYVIHHEPPRTLITKHNEAGRGAEFSELSIFNDRLLTFDDRTGDVFEILNNPEGTDSFCVPRFVITEGQGETDKGMKWEWSTVKDNQLYMGSMGKPYTRSDGFVVNRNNLWVVVMDGAGEMKRVDWTANYEAVRLAVKAGDPGYIIIEAANWSDALKKWVFLPRRISTAMYNEVEDEKMGATQLVLLDEDFTNAKVVNIRFEPKDLDPLKGFSTFAFVPGTGDKHALAIRSVEENCVEFTPACQQRSYFIVFDVLTGEVLSDELTYPDNIKLEGVEFVNINVQPPKYT